MNFTVPIQIRTALLNLGVDFGGDCAVHFTTSCARLLLSVILGYAVVVGSSIVKVPQILKLCSSKSTKGLSSISLLLESIGYFITMAYCISQLFPFGTYGESVFLLLQDIIIASMILLFSSKLRHYQAILFAILLTSLLSWVVYAKVIPLPVLTFLQSLTIPIFLSSKIPQIYSNWKTSSTGQLAFITYFLNFGGSIARVFTTLSELSDPILLLSYVLSSVLNLIITIQIIWYSRKSVKSNPNQKSKRS